MAAATIIPHLAESRRELELNMRFSPSSAAFVTERGRASSGKAKPVNVIRP
jgi:hypothetical protein